MATTRKHHDANDLKAWRLRLGLTQAEAARLLGIGERTYQRHEVGGSRLPGYLFAATGGVEAYHGVTFPEKRGGSHE